MPAAPQSEFVSLVVEALASLGEVVARRMFGGYSIRCDGLTFALVADEILYLKADDLNRPDFEALGLEPFRPFPDKPTRMSYYPLPDSALDDAEEMLRWGQSALAAARRASVVKPARKRRG